MSNHSRAEGKSAQQTRAQAEGQLPVCLCCRLQRPGAWRWAGALLPTEDGPPSVLSRRSPLAGSGIEASVPRGCSLAALAENHAPPPPNLWPVAPTTQQCHDRGLKFTSPTFYIPGLQQSSEESCFGLTGTRRRSRRVRMVTLGVPWPRGRRALDAFTRRKETLRYGVSLEMSVARSLGTDHPRACVNPENQRTVDTPSMVKVTNHPKRDG